MVMVSGRNSIANDSIYFCSIGIVKVISRRRRASLASCANSAGGKWRPAGLKPGWSRLVTRR